MIPLNRREAFQIYIPAWDIQKNKLSINCKFQTNPNKRTSLKSNKSHKNYLKIKQTQTTDQSKKYTKSLLKNTSYKTPSSKQTFHNRNRCCLIRTCMLTRLEILLTRSFVSALLMDDSVQTRSTNLQMNLVTATATSPRFLS